MRRAALLAALLALLLPATAGARVLVVGDSLEVGTAPYLRADLHGAAPLAVDARIGRPSAEGLQVLREKIAPADDVVVFDLGTNDGSPAQLAASLAGAAATAGNRCLVVATISRPPSVGAPAALMNKVVDGFAARHPNVQVVPWRDAVAGSHGLIRPDGVHGTAQGYALRGQLVAEAVQTCLAAPALQPAPLAPAPPPVVPSGRSAPRDQPPRPTGFRLRAYRRYAPLLTLLGAAALLPPPGTGLQIVTR